MSRAGLSVFVFAIYMLLVGAILMVVPNFLLSLVALPPTDEVWIRVVGTLTAVLGTYYLLAARAELRQFFHWSVFVRASVIVFFTAFVLFGFVPWPLILFGVVDLAAALWTAWALRSTKA